MAGASATRDRTTRLPIALALLALCGVACATERAPDVQHPRSFSGAGIWFRHPANWSVAEDAPETGEAASRIVFVESPGSAIVAVNHHPLGTSVSLDEYAEAFYRHSLSQLEQVQVGPLSGFSGKGGGSRSLVHAVVGGARREGVEQSFAVALAGQRVPHRFRAFKVEGARAAAFVVVQAADEDWDLVAPGFDLILESLRIE